MLLLIVCIAAFAGAAALVWESRDYSAVLDEAERARSINRALSAMSSAASRGDIAAADQAAAQLRDLGVRVEVNSP